MKHVYFARIVVLFVALSVGSAASAQDIGNMTQTIKLYQGVLSFPPAPWVKVIKDITNTKTSQSQQQNLFALEQIPKEQEFDSWKQLYGVYGFYLPEYDMKRFIQESINALSMGCKAKAKITLADAEDGAAILTYLCTDLAEPLVKDGYNTESGFLYVRQVKQSFAKVYLAWRSKREYMKTDKWPMNKENVTKAYEAMKTIRYFPSEQ